MEFLATFITALSVSMATLTLFWICRKRTQISIVHCAFATILFLYTIYHFLSCGGAGLDVLHEIATGLFIVATALMNGYASNYTIADGTINIGVDRRKTAESSTHSGTDRRVTDPHLIFKEANKV